MRWCTTALHFLSARCNKFFSDLCASRPKNRHIVLTVLLAFPNEMPEDAVTSTKPTATAEIRLASENARRAGTAPAYAFHDKVWFLDDPGLYTAQPDIFVVFTEAPGVDTNDFSGCFATKNKQSQTITDDHVYSRTSSQFLRLHCVIVPITSTRRFTKFHPLLLGDPGSHHVWKIFIRFD